MLCENNSWGVASRNEERRNLALTHKGRVPRGARCEPWPRAYHRQSKKSNPCGVYFLALVDQEVSILHNKSLEDRLRSVIQEVNEEIDYWYFLLELRYCQHLDRLNE